MAIKISSLTDAPRRSCTLKITVKENGEVRQEEIRVSFLKPTEALWRKVVTIEETAGPDDSVRVEQLLTVDIQSPDILDEDDSIHHITRADLMALDAVQVSELWLGVKDHFFLQMPVSTQETNTNSSLEQAQKA
jgi:hypothetical protein